MTFRLQALLRSGLKVFFLLGCLICVPENGSARTLLYVSTYDQTGTGSPSILKVSDTGAASVWNINWDNGQQLSDPEGMALDSAGNLYVNDSQHVYKIDPSGNGTTFATKANPFQAYGIAVDMAGNVYAGGFTSNFDSAIFKYSSSGTLLATWLAPSFMMFAMGSDGYLYTAEHFNDSIGRYNPLDGTRTTYASGLGRPSGLDFDAQGNLFVSGGYSPTLLYEVGPDGTPVSEFSQFPAFVSTGLTVDGEGNVYTATMRTSGANDTNRIMITNAEGDSTVFSQLAKTQRANDIVVVVPEPRTWMLLASGMALIVMAVRRKTLRTANVFSP